MLRGHHQFKTHYSMLLSSIVIRDTVYADVEQDELFGNGHV